METSFENPFDSDIFDIVANRRVEVVLIRQDCNDDDWRVRADRFLLNDIRLPWEGHPETRLFVVGDEMGANCAVWADNESDALDEAADQGWLDYLKPDPEDWAAMSEAEQGDFVLLGNASEPFDGQYLWLRKVDLSAQGARLLCLLAEARGKQWSDFGPETMEELL